MIGRRLVVLGDALLDRDVDGRVERLVPDAPAPVLDELSIRTRPGGAALAAMLAAADGHPVTLVTALAGDSAADELREALADEGVELIDLGLHGATPEKVRFCTRGQVLLRVDRGGAAGLGDTTAAARAAIGWASAVLVSDYGRGMAALPGLREALTATATVAPVIWDPHPRGPVPTPGVSVATPNAAEAALLIAAPRQRDGDEWTPRERLTADAARAAALREGWGADAVCLTRGADGAALVREQTPTLILPASSAEHGDPCGAGDRFASRLAGALATGTALEDAAVDAVACATAFVAAGGAGQLGRDRRSGGWDASRSDPLEAAELVRRVRSRGGVVVATGGCFDLLHAGHVRTLEAARQLGDCLVVCLNSDASVRRLKGVRRPLVTQDDRAAVLRALACVDAVVVFDEDTPDAVLRALRPHVWAKGGDYRDAELPEQRALGDWGGRAVLLPFVEGRSTTRLIEEAACRA